MGRKSGLVGKSMVLWSGLTGRQKPKILRRHADEAVDGVRRGPVDRNSIYGTAATALDKKRLPYGSPYLVPSVAAADFLHAIDGITAQLFLA